MAPVFVKETVSCSFDFITFCSNKNFCLTSLSVRLVNKILVDLYRRFFSGLPIHFNE